MELPAEPVVDAGLCNSDAAIARAESIMRAYAQQHQWRERQPEPPPGTTWDWTDDSAPPHPSELGSDKAHWRPLIKANRELFGIVQSYAYRRECLPQAIFKALAAALNVTDTVERRNRALRVAQLDGRNRAKRRLGIPAAEPTAEWLARQPGVGGKAAIIREWRRTRSYKDYLAAVEALWLKVYRTEPDYDTGHSAASEADRIEMLREAAPFAPRKIDAGRASRWGVQQVRKHKGAFPPPDARLVAYDLIAYQARMGLSSFPEARVALAAALGLTD